MRWLTAASLHRPYDRETFTGALAQRSELSKALDQLTAGLEKPAIWVRNLGDAE